jgi:hypothetical protein
VGRLLAAAREVDDGDDAAARLTLMVHPRSKDPSDAEEWSHAGYHATWAGGLSRALSIVSEQPLYADLDRVERHNFRLAWTDRLMERLAPHLKDPDLEDEVRRAVREIGGLEGDRHEAVDLISPLLLAGDEGVASLLAGELMGDFGGFLNRDLRQSDFALGYESTLAWARRGLDECGVPDEAVRGAVEAIETSRPVSWDEARRGHAKERDLPWRARLRLARFLLRAVRALLR